MFLIFNFLSLKYVKEVKKKGFKLIKLIQDF